MKNSYWLSVEIEAEAPIHIIGELESIVKLLREGKIQGEAESDPFKFRSHWRLRVPCKYSNGNAQQK